MYAQPISPELVHAQLANYAAEAMPNPADREHVLKHLGDIASSQSDTVVRTTDERESYSDADGQTVRPPAGVEVEVMNRADYTAYLHSPDARGGKVARRAELLSNYGHFREAALAPGDELGQGGSSSVRLISVDGKRYALRQSLSQVGRHGIDDHMAVSAIVENLPDEYKQRSERLVAATYEDGGKTIAELMPGKELDRLSNEEVRAIKPEQVDDLVGTIVAYGNAGLGVDPSKIANFFHDKEKGFGFLDLNVATASGERVPPVDEVLPSLARRIGTLLNKGGTPGSAEAYDTRVDALQSTLPFLEAYQQACDKLPDTVLGQDAKNYMKQLVERHIQRIADFSDPQWVASDLAHQAEARARSLANNDEDVP